MLYLGDDTAYHFFQQTGIIMAISDWNTSNANRSYPFIENASAAGIHDDEILDARFFVLSPIQPSVKVWLSRKEDTGSSRSYTFTNSFGDTMTFSSPYNTDDVTIWNTSGNTWVGYCVIGAKR